MANEAYDEELRLWVQHSINMDEKRAVLLAGKLGKDRSAVSRILSGERKLKARELPILRDFFGQDPPGFERDRPAEEFPAHEVKGALDAIESKIDALARHLGLGAGEDRSSSAVAAERRLSGWNQSRRRARRRSPDPDASRPENRQSKSKHPPSAPGAEESKEEDQS